MLRGGKYNINNIVVCCVLFYIFNEEFSKREVINCIRIELDIIGIF